MTLNILGVTVSDLSVSEHVRQAISAPAQTLHTLRILRARGMDDTALQMIFQTTVITKLLCASSACMHGIPTASERIADADSKLFYCMLYNNNHVLHYLLCDRCDNSTYNPKKILCTIALYQTKLDICQNALSEILIQMLFENVY